MVENSGNQETSRYNSGLLEIGRLDEIWRACRVCSVVGKLDDWNGEIEAAWRELSTNSKPEKKEYFKYCSKVILSFNNSIERCHGYEREVGGNKYTITKPRTLRKILTKKEQFVRGIQEKSGKGSSYKDESSREFDWRIGLLSCS